MIQELSILTYCLWLDNQRNDKRAQMMHIPASSSLLDSISDTLVNAFAKLRKPDERFESMKENIHRLEEDRKSVV